MTSYTDIKSAAYIRHILKFAEELLGIKFRRVGDHKFAAFCPFHNDTQDSFRVYVNKNDEVRFHCFGECKSGGNHADWDIYDLIMIRNKCRFTHAQVIFADYLGIKDLSTYAGSGQDRPEQQVLAEPDEPVSFLETDPTDPQLFCTLDEAAMFYHDVLVENPEGRFDKVFRYLDERGVDKTLIEDFSIGFSPPFKDEEYLGRALIQFHLHRFTIQLDEYHRFNDAGLLRLLNDGSYYQRFIDFRRDIWGAFGVYADFFAGRITFPIYDIDQRAHGMVGRRPDRRKQGLRWMKQKGAVNTKSWLYGIDKAHQAIQHYKTVIIVEGIFDYFAFFNLMQSYSKPVVVSTLGANLSDEVISTLSGLGVENYVIAFDWDAAGKKAIMKAQNSLNLKVYHLGGMEEGQDPAGKLKDVVGAIDGFSLKHLMAAAKKSQDESCKPINISYITSGSPGKRNVMFNPASNENDFLPVPKNLTDPVKEYHYNIDDFLPLLTYDNGNQAALETKLHEIQKLLETKPIKPNSEDCFTIPAKFISTEAYDDLGAALILWLWVAIHQQRNGRRVVGIDSELAIHLNTSRTTFNKYKQQLKSLGYLNIRPLKKGPGLSVNYFPKG